MRPVSGALAESVRAAPAPPLCRRSGEAAALDSIGMPRPEKLRSGLALHSIGN